MSMIKSNVPSDERQVMSIDSQIKEMSDLAKKGGLFVKEIRQESHSAKVSGQRPGVCPLGYMNRAFGGTKDIILDPNRAPLIQEAFHRVAQFGHSGRTIKKWLDKSGFTTTANFLTVIRGIQNRDG